MGNRAVIILTDSRGDHSPAIYVHWTGSMVPQFLAKWWPIMADRRDDLHYGAARLIGVLHNEIGGNLSLGCWNLRDIPKAPAMLPKFYTAQSHGDAGVFVVNCKTGDVQRYDRDESGGECDAPERWTLGKDGAQ